MENQWFYKFGKWISYYRKSIVLIWVVIFLSCLPFLSSIMKPFQSTGFENPFSESQETYNMLSEKLGYQNHRLLILFKKDSLNLSDADFARHVKKSLKGLKKLKQAHEVILSLPTKNQKNHNVSLAIIAFKKEIPLTPEAIKDIEHLIKYRKHLKIFFGGEDVFLNSVNQQTQKDLFHADMIATPFSIITLLFVFGSVMAALMPVLVGSFCALAMLVSLYFLAHYMSLSIFTTNIALLLGLCLSLDYALFIISRFREELPNSNNISVVIGRTLATAGKAVFFSGLAVFASLSALLIFPINILYSVGIGGLCAVFLAVMGALTFLPALLSILQHKINAGVVFKYQNHHHLFWRKLAQMVIKNPVIFAFTGLVSLLILTYPLQHLKLGISDYHILPKHSEGRQFFNQYQQYYDVDELTPIIVVLKSKEDLFSEKNIVKVHELIDKIERQKSVDKVSGYLTLIPNGTLKQYLQLYKMPLKYQPQAVQQILKTSTTSDVGVLYIVSKFPPESTETQQLIDYLRVQDSKGLEVLVTGVPANNLDVFNGIHQNLKTAIYLILSVSFVVLMILLRSLFLPLKAIFLNILSLAATYGVLVYIFQDGHFHQFLNFEPQGNLDISMLVIIFCALFGFSMDYEVFLLTRIQESYHHFKNNDKSIVFGIEHSAKIITSAALIVIVLCLSFLVADVLMVKAFGLGIAIAIFIDAFIIRTLMVPAIMAIAGRINWYFPNWLQKILFLQ